MARGVMWVDSSVTGAQVHQVTSVKIITCAYFSLCKCLLL